MRILVIGSGGREHALVWKLAQSPHAAQIWCAPGNAGIAGETLAANGAPVQCLDLGAENLPALLAFAREHRPDLTVVGPDNPLALGIVNLFQRDGLRIWGPNQKAARFESSKVFSQRFMEEHGIPTARSGIFTDPQAARTFAASLEGRCAVKADGLALGKGVLMCSTVAEAEGAIDEILVRKAFGGAGASIVIQEFLEGMEISLHALCDGATALLFPTSQDHKRALEGDLGLNTGGMGTYSPTPFLDAAGLADAERQILVPWLQGCAAENIQLPGHPLPRVDADQGGTESARIQCPVRRPGDASLSDAAGERLGRIARRQRVRHPAPIGAPVAARGVGVRGDGVRRVPGSYAKGKPIHGLDEAARRPNTKVFHAGSAESGGQIVTNGGRVLGVTAWAADLAKARAAAYAAVESIQFEGAQFRRDIGAKALAGC